MPAKTTKNRQTGTRITVGDAESLGHDPAENAWYTICEDHNTLVGHPTATLARSHASDPAGWCEICGDLWDAKQKAGDCKIIGRLVKLVNEWGGELRLVSEKQYESYCDGSNPEYAEAPFSSASLGIDWEPKLIVYTARVEWFEIIHEMGHVFATTDGAFDDEIDEEFDFFGWEFLVAKRVKGNLATWIKSQSDYCVTDPEPDPEEVKQVSASYIHTADFGCLTTKQQTEMIKERIRHAVKRGTVRRTPQGLIPVSVR